MQITLQLKLEAAAPSIARIAKYPSTDEQLLYKEFLLKSSSLINNFISLSITTEGQAKVLKTGNLQRTCFDLEN